MDTSNPSLPSCLVQILLDFFIHAFSLLLIVLITLSFTHSVTLRQSLDELIPIYKLIKEVKGESLSLELTNEVTTHFGFSCFRSILPASMPSTEGQDIPMILVGNKSDEEDHRKIKKETGQKYVDELFRECSFIETSAKTNSNVQEAFQVRSW